MAANMGTDTTDDTTMDGGLEPSPLALPRNGYPSICCLTSFSSQSKPSIRTSWDWQNLRHISVPLVQGKLGKVYKEKEMGHFLHFNHKIVTSAS